MTAQPAFPLSELAIALSRPRAAGKFIFAGQDKLYVRGVSFDCDAVQDTRATVDADLALLAAQGANVIRCAGLPHKWLLDAARKHGLQVLAGLAAGSGSAFLDNPAQLASLEELIKQQARSITAHPALFGFALDVPLTPELLARYKRSYVESRIERLYLAARRGAPDVLCTFVNRPATAFLNLPFLDFVCFDLSADSSANFAEYLNRLQWLAGERPLFITGLGAAGIADSETAQAAALEANVRVAFAAGCAGVFVAAASTPGPTLAALRAAFADVPFPAAVQLPRITVVAECFDGNRQPGGTLQALRSISYPDYEVIALAASGDALTVAAAQACGARFVGAATASLGAARNAALAAATGEIITFVGVGASPDPDWLRYLGAGFAASDCAAVGSPSPLLAAQSPNAAALSSATAGPLAALFPAPADGTAPAYSMAYRRAAINAAGGFDPRFLGAGADVDLCWRLRAQGGWIGLLPAAVLMTPQPGSATHYLRRQQDDGADEMLLRRKWPQRFSAGRRGASSDAGGAGRPFSPRVLAGRFVALLGTPKWYLLLLALLLLAALGLYWTPLLLAAPLLALAVLATLTLAAVRATRARPSRYRGSLRRGLRFRAYIATIYLLQPLAVLRGQMRYLSAAIAHTHAPLSLPLPAVLAFSSVGARSREEWVKSVAAAARAGDLLPINGANPAVFDFSLPGLTLGAAQLELVSSADPSGGQQVRCATWPRIRPGVIVVLLLFLGLALSAGGAGAWFVSAVLGLFAFAITWRTLYEAATTLGALREALRHVAQQAAPVLPVAPAPIADPQPAAPLPVPAFNLAALAPLELATPPLSASDFWLLSEDAATQDQEPTPWEAGDGESWALPAWALPDTWPGESVATTVVNEAAPPLPAPTALAEAATQEDGATTSAPSDDDYFALPPWIFDAVWEGTTPAAPAAPWLPMPTPPAIYSNGNGSAHGEHLQDVLLLPALQLESPGAARADVAVVEREAAPAAPPPAPQQAPAASSDVAALWAMAAGYTQLGRLEEAIALYRTILSRPNVAGFALDAALARAEVPEDKAGHRRQIHQLRGEIFERQGRYRDAVAEFRKIGWE